MIQQEKKDRYINFYTDFAFKRFFGTEVNKDLLLSFLNSLLADQEEITEITYLNTEHLGTREPDRKAVFDVYCKNNRNEYFLVEMQKAEQQFFKDRSVYYSTFPIREQAIKGKWDYELKRVYTIGILNFTFDDTDPNYYHHEVKLVDIRTKEVFYDKLTYIYLEMPKFNKSLDELTTTFDKWMYAIRHLPDMLEKPKIMQEDIFNRLFQQAEIAQFSKKELDEYEESLKAFRDWYSVTKTSFNKGRAEGIEEGMAMGKAEGRAEGMAEGMAKGKAEGRAEGMAEGMAKALRLMAKKMKEEGIDVNEISKITSLPPSEIENL